MEAGTQTHESNFTLNDTILLYTMALPPIELVEHLRYTDVGSLQHALWNHGTIIRRGITRKKIPYKSLLNSAWL